MKKRLLALGLMLVLCLSLLPPGALAGEDAPGEETTAAAEGAVSLAGAKVTVKDQTYTGKKLKPKPTVKLDGVKLKKGTDFTVSYADNKNVGTATVTVTGIGTYTGTKTATFEITKAANEVTAGDRYASYSAKAQEIELGATALGGKLTYKSGDSAVTVSADGVVTLPEKYSGTVTIRITAKGKNYETAAKKVKVTVLDAPVLSGAESGEAKKLTASWQSVKGASGYQVQCSAAKKFSSGVQKATVKKSVTSKEFSDLTSGTTYYVRVRAYKTVDGTKYYSAWSAVSKVTVKSDEGPAPIGDPIPSVVYVSRTGKIHIKPDCSGMKYYTEMTYDEALSHNYTKCEKCF